MNLRPPLKHIVCVLGFALPTIAQTPLYVDVNAVPPGNGSLATPFVSIQQAMSSLSPTSTQVTTIFVAPGTYVESVHCHPYSILRSQQGPLVTVIRPALPGHTVVDMPLWCDCMSLTPEVDGFTITGFASQQFQAAVECDEGFVRNCILTGNTGPDAYAFRSDYIGTIEQSTIAGNDNGLLVGLDTALFVRRVAFDNRVTNYRTFQFDGAFTNCVGSGLPPTQLLVNPGFWNTAAGDFHLRPDAPARSVAGGFAGALPYDANYTPPSFTFCYGDGTFADHTTACPCGNTGVTGHGCASGANARGALLEVSGHPQDDTLVLAASEMGLTALGVYLQHDGIADHVFHDGVLCAGGNLLRLRYRNANNGASAFPDSSFAIDATTTLAQRGFVTPGSGAVRYYSVFYRAAAATFCPPATANVTNGCTVVW